MNAPFTSDKWGVYALDGALFQTRPLERWALQWGARWMKVPYIVRRVS